MRYSLREIDAKGLSLCKQQGQIFLESLNRYKGSSYVFIQVFMESLISEDIDINKEINIAQVFENLDKYQKLSSGHTKINSDAIYWIGYVYRYWAYTYNMRSKTIFSIASSTLMEKLYAPYHTFDPAFAIDRINEGTDFSIVKDDSLELMKKIYGAK